MLHMSTCYQMRTALIQSNIMHMTVSMNHNLQSLPHFLVIWKKQSHFTQRAAILNNQTSHERKGRYAAKLSTILVKILAIEHHHAKTPASIDKHTQRSSDAQRNQQTQPTDREATYLSTKLVFCNTNASV